ncbi:MAG: hypothetical protein KJ620_04770 [Candidatus Edwardsbacteria bacterium]|nr:hypothetical protein [Candidatus Edwardsbacteria bacterium]MBU1577235.1 hypothetical protein [Candidatus Edwardsbacteria bacterium]MBU2594084.1 hypothetical protein [Candidatus Edwardsbacteria bacterium]
MIETAKLIYLINLILCLAILGFGIWGYRKKKNLTALMVGVAFGLFGGSHLATLFNLQIQMESFLIVVRIIAYLMVAVALYLESSKK